MIQTMQPYSHHTLVALVTESIPGLLSLEDTLVNRIGLGIIAQVGLLFLLYPSTFPVGLAFGFIFHKSVQAIAKDVNDVYDSYQTWAERIFFYVVGGLFAIYTFPITLPIATLYCSALCGAQFRHNSLNRYPQLASDSKDENTASEESNASITMPTVEDERIEMPDVNESN